MMAFTTMPPEIISARMYSGPGSDPMLAAGSAWGGLAAEMNSMVTSYQAMIARLASAEWMGPASAAMAAAAKPYLGWLTATAAQAEQAATQARTAAAVFEQAHAMTVPPPVITANRALLRQLITTNILGHNAGAIAAVEAHYGEMWAQDSLAMHTYAAQSAAATRMEPFSSPPETTNLAGTANQATAVAHATGNAAATKTLTSMPKALDMLATPTGTDPASATAAAQGASDIFKDPSLAFGQKSFDQSLSSASLGANGVNAVWRGLSGIVGASKFMADGAKAAGAAGAAAGAANAAGGAAAAASGLGGVAGGLGNAGMIGGLSVPPAWASAPMAAGTAFGPVSGGSWQPVGGSGLMGAMPEAAPHGMPGVPGVPAAGTAAGMAGRAGGGFGMAPRYGFRVPVMPRLPGIG